MSESSPSAPEPWVKSAAWPSWSTLLRRLGRESWVAPADGPESASPATHTESNDWFEPLRPAWHPRVGPCEAPSPAEVLPTLPSPRFKIQCIPLEPADRLPEQMRLECEAQLAAGLRLVSSFSHDGHMFLVFKKN